MDEQLPLFEMDPGGPRHRRGRAGSSKVRYQRFKPRTRWLCDDCVRAIHELGVAEAPLPRPVRWRRVDENDNSMLLCDKHKHNREDGDGGA